MLNSDHQSLDAPPAQDKGSETNLLHQGALFDAGHQPFSPPPPAGGLLNIAKDIGHGCINEVVHDLPHLTLDVIGGAAAGAVAAVVTAIAAKAGPVVGTFEVAAIGGYAIYKGGGVSKISEELVDGAKKVMHDVAVDYNPSAYSATEATKAKLGMEGLGASSLDLTATTLSAVGGGLAAGMIKDEIASKLVFLNKNVTANFGQTSTAEANLAASSANIVKTDSGDLVSIKGVPDISKNFNVVWSDIKTGGFTTSNPAQAAEKLQAILGQSDLRNVPTDVQSINGWFASYRPEYNDLYLSKTLFQSPSSTTVKELLVKLDKNGLPQTGLINLNLASRFGPVRLPDMKVEIPEEWEWLKD